MSKHFGIGEQLSQWWNKLYSDWTKTRKRKTLTTMVDELNLNPDTIDQFLSGIGELGDENTMKAYELFEIVLADPLLSYITRNWNKLPPGEQKRIRELVEKHANTEA
ncbi:MAG TPA: hypothetical protein PK530_06905 [Anaerolineales bacterium]|nr:hypothetical protein [Anaerolineales bacterium]